MRQFVESLKRLYVNGMISADKICELYKTDKINEDEKNYILST